MVVICTYSLLISGIIECGIISPPECTRLRYRDDILFVYDEYYTYEKKLI